MYTNYIKCTKCKKEKKTIHASFKNDFTRHVLAELPGLDYLVALLFSITVIVQFKQLTSHNLNFHTVKYNKIRTVKSDSLENKISI